mgnify:CR=1 FL=1
MAGEQVRTLAAALAAASRFPSVDPARAVPLRVLAADAVRFVLEEKFDALGMDPWITTPEQFGAVMRDDTAKYARINLSCFRASLVAWTNDSTSTSVGRTSTSTSEPAT